MVILTQLFPLFVYLSSYIHLSEEYSMGAPDSACSRMNPGHGFDPQPSQLSPYILELETLVISTGQSIDIHLTLKNSTETALFFKGFIIQARNASDLESPVGSFESITDNVNIVTCGKGIHNSITHRTGERKNKVSVTWIAPSNINGEEKVIFKYSVVQSYDKYWVGLESTTVSITESSFTTTTSDKLIPMTTLETNEVTEKIPEISSASFPILNKEFESLLNSQNTTLTTKSPSKTVSFYRSTTTITTTTTVSQSTTTVSQSTTTKLSTSPTTKSEETILNFVDSEHSIYTGCGRAKSCFGMPANCLSLKKCSMIVSYELEKIHIKFTMVGKSNGYISLGLSKDTRMGDDLVTSCYLDSESGRVNIQSSYNEGYSNQPLVPDNVGLLNEFEGYYENGFISCTYRRPERVIVKEKTYRLLEESFVILLAEGEIQMRNKHLLKHRSRLSAEEPLALGISRNLEGKSKLYIYLHGSFMVGAWVFASSIGIIFARYFKTTWTNYKVFSKDMWFLNHRLLMSLTFILTITAFILIFVELDFEFSKTDMYSNPHAPLGCLTSGLCFLQPFIAILRCEPSSSKRVFFNWIHWLIGNLAHITAFVTLFFAVDLEKASLPREMDWLLISLVAFHFIFHIIFSLLMCVTESKTEKRGPSIPMRNFRSGTHTLYPEYEELKRDSPGRGAKIFLLILYILVSGCVSAALIALIILTPSSSSLKNLNLF